MRLIEGLEKSLQTKLPMIDFQKISLKFWISPNNREGRDGRGGEPGWDKIPLLTVAGSPRVSA